MVAHGLLEYALGALLFAAPFLFSFDSNGATAASVLIGAAIFALALVTDTPTAAVRRLPLESHIVLDYVLGVLLVAAPFIFGFSGDTGVTAFFLLTGLAYLALSIGTGYRRRA
jgi:VIT1/CCC1 family predicted Fe2+/Mn2+ transporter